MAVTNCGCRFVNLVQCRSTDWQASMLGLLTLKAWPMLLGSLVVCIRQRIVLLMVTGRTW